MTADEFRMNIQQSDGRPSICSTLEVKKRQQEVHRLNRKELLSYAEIAQRLGISERAMEMSRIVNLIQYHTEGDSLPY